MEGWIKINRSIVNHWLWGDAERLKWWIDLLFMAAWERKRQLVGKQLVILQRGQLIASLSFLCKRWKRSRTMVEPFLNLLVGEGMIGKDISRNISIITILNYEKYQAHPDAYLDAYPDAYLDTHLEVGLTPEKSSNCGQLNARDDAYLDAHLDTHLDAYPDAYLDAHLEATNKEIKNKRNNKSSSLRSDDSSNGFDKEKVDADKFMIFFNSELEKAKSIIPRLKSMTSARRANIMARCREHGREAMATAVRNAAASDFLNGKNDNSWVASFTWLMRPNNFLKVLEGDYDNKNDRQERKDKRRGFEVDAVSAEEYKTSF